MTSSHRPARLKVQTRIEAPLDIVFAFISDLRNQCWIADRCLEVTLCDDRDDAGGGARVASLRRVGRRRFGEARSLGSIELNSIMSAIEWAGGGRIFVLWEFAEGSDGTTVVRLQLALTGLGVADRLLLFLGGRSWLRQQAEQGLTELDQIMTSYSAGVAVRFRRLGSGRLPQG
jgi:hypothetical protein